MSKRITTCASVISIALVLPTLCIATPPSFTLQNESPMGCSPDTGTAKTLWQHIAGNETIDGGFDKIHTDYDILAKLFKDADLMFLLGGPGKEAFDEGKLTLLAPNDWAMQESAMELLGRKSVNDSTSEKEVYEGFKAYFGTFQSPQKVLSAILNIHVLEGDFTRENLADSKKFVSVGKDPELELEKDGLLFFSPDNVDGNVEPINPPTVEFASFIISPLCPRATNGHLHPIDRLIFPLMDKFPLRSSATSPALASKTPSLPPPSAAPTSDLFGASISPIATQSPLATLAPSAVAIDSGATPESSPTPSSSPLDAVDQGPSCFPSSARVHLLNGEDVGMADLTAGTVVKASERKASAIYLFTHKTGKGLWHFTRIKTERGHELIVTPGHYVYANGKLQVAGKVRAGDTLRTLDGPAMVSSVGVVSHYGLIAPHTLHGDIVVNRVVVSTYTDVIYPSIAHALLSPVRALVHLRVATEPLGSLLYNGFAIHLT